ncbi:unnamed protein product [Phytomonas sp. Hart1]|nr:unnamed protein product [Phytomonas sp. Hart1]|eukprot:CCW71452.1 unnamed protein product [Phytomonas sp. isolate Hart1]
MYHDAPIEAAMSMVHRRHRRAHNTPSGLFISEAADSKQLQEVLDFLLSSTQIQGPGAPMMRIALQFPDELLEDAPAVVQELETRLYNDPRYPMLQKRFMESQNVSNGVVEGKEGAPASGPPTIARPSATSTSTSLAVGRPALRPASLPSTHPLPTPNPNSPTGVRFFILADSTFGSCCPDEITAQHYQSDLIVHFGDACMSRSTRLPVIYLHPPFSFHCIRRSDARSLGILPAPGGDVSSNLPGIPGGPAEPAAVNLVVGMLDRVRGALRQNIHEWHAGPTPRDQFASLEDAPPLRAQLVVVGPHSVRGLLEAAESQWRSSAHEEEEGVCVVWSRFINCDARLIVKSPRADVDVVMDKTTEHLTPQPCPSCEPLNNSSRDSTEWIINGVCFPRLPFHGESESASRPAGAPLTVQYFLYVGPSDGPHLVHLLGVHEYNRFHYSEVEREFFLREQGPTGDANARSAMPVLSVLDEHFAIAAASSVNSPSYTKEVGNGPVGVLDPAASPEVVDHFVEERICTNSDADPLKKLLWTSFSTTAEAQFKRRQRQRDFNIEVVRSSSAVGILVASLAIEGYYELTMLLHRLLRRCGKRAYVIYIGHLNEFKLANFESTVDSFVVVACPNSRGCHFPNREDRYLRPVVSPAEVLLALTARGPSSSQYGLPTAFHTGFDSILPPLRAAVEEFTPGPHEDATRKEPSDWVESAALVRIPGSRTVMAGDAASAAHGALARLHERAFFGLDPCLGKTAVQTSVGEGKFGIARGYQTERAQQNPDPANGPAG